MKKPVPLKYSYRLISHGPVTLLTTRRRGRPNVCTIAWIPYRPRDPFRTSGDGNRSAPQGAPREKDGIR